MPRIRIPARDSSARHWAVPVHDDQLLRATAVADALSSRGTWTERNDALRAALAIGLLGVDGVAAGRRRASPRSPSGGAAAMVIAFPYEVVCKARDLANANAWASAAATVRGAIDCGLAHLEHVAATTAPKPAQPVPAWLEHDSG